MEARANTMIALFYMDGGNYSKAFEYCMEGLKVARQSKDLSYHRSHGRCRKFV